MATMVKDNAIRGALLCLEERLGIGAFQIIDHWEADLTAIGIASPSDTRRLVYVAADRERSGIYHGRLERAPEPGSGLPYEDCGEFKDVDLDELVRVVSHHLGISMSSLTRRS
jgi:hypothetical protein